MLDNFPYYLCGKFLDRKRGVFDMSFMGGLEDWLVDACKTEC